MENPVVLKMAEHLYMRSFGFKEMPGKDRAYHWPMHREEFIGLAYQLLKIIGETQN